MLPRDPDHREHAVSRRAYAREAWKDTAGMSPEQRREVYHQQINEWDQNNPNDLARRRASGPQQSDSPIERRGVQYNGTRWI